jgi:hypothetical protein
VAVSNSLTADDPLVSRDGRSTIASLRVTSQTPSDALLDRVLKSMSSRAPNLHD